MSYIVSQSRSWGGVDDEHCGYIVSVLAADRRELERRVEAYEMKEQANANDNIR